MNGPTVGGADNTSTLRAAVYGHIMEHGVEPSFVLMSSDVAKAIFHEVQTNAQYKGLIKTGLTPDSPMFINLGTGPIEIGQVVGTGRVELVVDATIMKARKQ